MRVLTYAELRPSKKLSAAFRKVVAASERDDFRSADVKKLYHGDLYRAKLDSDARLLLRFVRHGEATVCLALEIVEQHAYDRARFLRGAVIDAAALEAAAAVDTAPTPVATVRYLHPGRAEFHLQAAPLSFDDLQDQVYRSPAPLLVVGAAGSGKTALLLERLRREEGNVLYVTQSAFLAQSARGLYYAHGYANEAQEVDFLSFRDVLASLKIPPGRAIGYRDFEAFFARHKQALRLEDANQTFEEIRGVLSAEVTGPLSREAYLALGVRQSLFPVETRDGIYTFFERYRAWLAEGTLHDPVLLAHPYAELASPRYDFLVVDEVQDLTNVELALLLRLLQKPGAFVLCGDSNQIVHPNFFAWSRVRTLFFENRGLASESGTLTAVLDANYRNARAVVTVANTLLKIKHARFGSVDRESSRLVRAVAEEEGSVAALSASPEAMRDLDQRTRGSTEVAVLVLREEDNAAARAHFKTPLLFAIHEAKGLEYETVIVFRFVSSERAAFAEVTNGVTLDDLRTEELAFGRAKDKADKSLDAYKFYVNALFVALTRAVRQVVLVESDTKHPLFGLLGVAFPASGITVASKVSSADEWQREARRLELQGKHEQAAAIREGLLGLTPVPWTVLSGDVYRDHVEKAFQPKSPFGKAKKLLYEFACGHDLAPLATRLLKEAAYPQASLFEREKAGLAARFQKPFLTKNTLEIFGQVAKHGPDFRNAWGQTPLMLAASVGDLVSARRLVDLGAQTDLVDPLGRTALGYYLGAATTIAKTDPGGQRAGDLAELLSAHTVDLDIDGRLVRLDRNKAEYLFFAVFTLALRACYGSFGRIGGVTSERLEGLVQVLPTTVIPPHRQQRTYVNGLLARNEHGSSNPASRKLWVREKRGEYIPSATARIATRGPRGEQVWVPLREHLGLPVQEEHHRADGFGFLTRERIVLPVGPRRR